jgi:hypothetical protein
MSEKDVEAVISSTGHKYLCVLTRLPEFDCSQDVTADIMHIAYGVHSKFIKYAKGSATPANRVKRARERRATAARKRKRGGKQPAPRSDAQSSAEERELDSHKSIVFEYAQLKAGDKRLSALDKLFWCLRDYLPCGLLTSSAVIFGRTSGFKSHDHLEMIRFQILPYLLRHTWQIDQVSAMASLLQCIRDFIVDKPSEEFDRRALEEKVAVALCNFEDNFPACELVTILHVMLHVPQDLAGWGSARHRWQFAVERYLGWLVGLVKNRSAPIPNALKMHSVASFSTGQEEERLLGDLNRDHALHAYLSQRWRTPTEVQSPVVYPYVSRRYSSKRFLSVPSGKYPGIRGLIMSLDEGFSGMCEVLESLALHHPEDINSAQLEKWDGRYRGRSVLTQRQSVCLENWRTRRVLSVTTKLLNRVTIHGEARASAIIEDLRANGRTRGSQSYFEMATSVFNRYSRNSEKVRVHKKPFVYGRVLDFLRVDLGRQVYRLAVVEMYTTITRDSASGGYLMCVDTRRVSKHVTVVECVHLGRRVALAPSFQFAGDIVELRERFRIVLGGSYYE